MSPTPLDVGHCWLVDATSPLAWIERLGDRIVAVHVHGTYHRPDRGFENHQSLRFEDCLDPASVMRALDDAGFDGPILFEILAKDMDAYLAAADESRAILLNEG